MWWIILGVVALILIIGSEASQADKVVKISAVYPEKLKPLLKEEFPEFEKLFTTSFCSTFWEVIVSYAKEKTKEKDVAKALVKFDKLYEKPKNKELFDKETNELMKKHYSPEFYSLLDGNEHEQAKLDRVVELAMTKTIAELS